MKKLYLFYLAMMLMGTLPTYYIQAADAPITAGKEEGDDEEEIDNNILNLNTAISVDNLEGVRAAIAAIRAANTDLATIKWEQYGGPPLNVAVQDHPRPNKHLTDKKEKTVAEKTQLKELLSLIKSKKTNLDRLNSLLKAITTSIEEIENNKVQKENEINRLATSIEQQSKVVEDAERRKKSVMTEIEKINVNIQAKKLDSDTLNASLKIQQEALEALEEAYDKEEYKLKALVDEINKKKAALGDPEKGTKAQEDSAAKKRTEAETLKDQIRNESAELKALESKKQQALKTDISDKAAKEKNEEIGARKPSDIIETLMDELPEVLNIQDSESGNTALHVFISKNNQLPSALLELLLWRQPFAKRRALHVNPYIRNNNNKTPLQLAFENEVDFNIIQYFPGADLITNLSSVQGYEKQHKEEALKAIKEQNVDVNTVKDYATGETLLHRAVNNADLELIKALLECNANPNITTIGGKSAFDIAQGLLSSNPNKQRILNVLNGLPDEIQVITNNNTQKEAERKKPEIKTPNLKEQKQSTGTNLPKTPPNSSFRDGALALGIVTTILLVGCLYVFKKYKNSLNQKLNVCKQQLIALEKAYSEKQITEQQYEEQRYTLLKGLSADEIAKLESWIDELKPIAAT